MLLVIVTSPGNERRRNNNWRPCGWCDEAYTSYNTNRLDVDGVVKKIMSTDYVKEELEGKPHAVEA